MYMQFIHLFMYFLPFFIIAVVQLLCVIVCRTSVNKDVYIKHSRDNLNWRSRSSYCRASRSREIERSRKMSDLRA